MEPHVTQLRPTRGYRPRGGRPPLDVDFEAVYDAVLGVHQGNGETITSVATRFGVSRAWIHKHVYPEIDVRDDGSGAQQP